MNDMLSRVVLVAAVVLLPSAALASQIKITTDPTGATVQLDGITQGQAPVTIPKVGRGSHTLKVSMEGYVTRDDVIEVDGESDFQIHAPLNPAPKLPPPQPTPHVEPPKPAYVPPAQPTYTPPPPPDPKPQPAPLPPYVENKSQSPTPVSENPTGWGAQKKSLVLMVETVPAEAYVQIVGMQEVKKAPATFTGFSPGLIQLQVRAPGYKDKKVEVDLKHDARTRVVLDKI